MATQSFSKLLIISLVFCIFAAWLQGCGKSGNPDDDGATDDLLDPSDMPDGVDATVDFDGVDAPDTADVPDVPPDGPLPCTPGEVRCGVDGIRERCNEAGAWVDDPCSEGYACDGEGECLPLVCERGEKRCDPDDPSRIQECNETRTGWVFSEECEEDETCEYGVCVPAECVPGSTICTADGQIRECNESGTGYGDPHNCAEGYVCEGDTCIEMICTPGESECIDMRRMRICNYLGTGYDIEECPDGTACAGGECIERICEPHEKRCDPGDLQAWQQCNASGTAWGESHHCPSGQGCLDGLCVARICEPGSTICAPDGRIRTCNESGTAWGDPEDCPDGQACFEGECMDIFCTPGDSECVDPDTIRVCNSTGTATIEEPCGEGYVCEDDTCMLQVCIPGLRQCAGPGAIEECNDTGTDWATVETCGADEMCLEGRCLNDCEVAELSRSTVGCRFYAVDQRNRYDSGTFYIVVGNTHNSRTATVNLEHRRGGTWTSVSTTTVGPNSIHTFAPGNNWQVSTSTAFGAGYGFRIMSNLPIVAYQLNAISSCTGEGSMLIPANGLDNGYYVLNYKGFSGPPLFTVIGTEDGTTVDITPSEATRAGGGIPAIGAGSTYTMTLNECDLAQILASNNNGDLTGTHVVASAPVAVFAATYCSHVVQYCDWCHAYDCTSCDPLEEQIIPSSSWGKKYIAPVSPEWNWGYFRVVAEQNNTTINVTLASTTGARYPSGVTPPLTLDALEMGEFELGCNGGGCGVAYLESEKPFMLMDYYEGGSCRTHPRCGKDHCPGNYGDPSMAIVPPIEQFMNEYLFLTPSGFTNNYVTVIRQVGSTVTLDGAPISGSFITAGGSGYESGHIAVSLGAHHIESETPFGIILAGYGYANSYGYPGGMNLRRINF